MSAPTPPAVLARRWLPLLLACALGAALPIALMLIHLRISPRQDPAGERYNELIRGFEAGHLYLPRPVPAALARLPDPYDSDANESIRGGLDQLLDLSYFRGRLYLYFGVVPAVTAFLPWHLATGRWLSEAEAVTAAVAAGTLASAALLAAAWRRLFPETGSWLVAGCVLLLATAGTTTLIAARPHVWEVPVAEAYALAMAALGTAWLACDRPRPGRSHQSVRAVRLGWLAATGLLAGLAVGCRANLALAATFLAAAAAWGSSRSSHAPQATPTKPTHALPTPHPTPIPTPTPSRAHAFLAAFVPLGAVGLALAWYNWARFGTPLQFGQHYQLATDNVHSRTVFSAAFLLENARLYFLSALRWGGHFPFAWRPAPLALSAGHGDVEDVVGAFPAAPALLLAFAAPLAWRRRGDNEGALLRGCAAALAGHFLLSAAVMLLFYGACNRYEVDFLPSLALLACLGILGTDRAAAAWPRVLRIAARALTGILIAYSVAAMTLCSVARCEFTSWQDVAEARISGSSAADRSAAIDAGRRLVALSNGMDGYRELGMTQLAAAQPAAAAESFAAAARLDPDDFVTEFDLGLAQIESRAVEPGLRHLLDALRRHPGNASYEGNAGRILVSAGHDHDAIPLLSDAVRAAPGSAPLHAALGKALLRSDSAAAALPSLRQAVLLDPGQADAQNDLGVALFESGERDQAIARFEEALRLQPNLAGARRNLEAALIAPPGRR